MDLTTRFGERLQQGEQAPISASSTCSDVLWGVWPGGQRKMGPCGTSGIKQVALHTGLQATLLPL